MNKAILLSYLTSKYLETTTTGELVTKAPYTPKSIVRIGGRKLQLTTWVYLAHHGELPVGRLFTSSTSTNSVDPAYLYSISDIQEAA